MTLLEKLSDYQKDKIDAFLELEQYMYKYSPEGTWGVPNMVKLWEDFKTLDKTQ